MRDLEGKPNDAVAITGGSGGVYIINYLGKPVFVFKPIDEAPGMPGNLKHQTGDDLKVFRNRCLDSNRIAFRIDQGIFREYGVGILGYYPRRAMTTLKLSSAREEFKTGLLMEYVPHVASLYDLAELARIERCRDLIKEYEMKLIGEITDDERKKIEAGLAKTKTRLADFPDGLLTKVKDPALEEALVLCKGWGDLQAPLWTMPIFQKISKSSILELISYSFHVPDFDRNADNIFLVETTSSKLTREKRYKLVMFDADQTHGDTWQRVNSPMWLGCTGGDIILKENEKLREDIISFNATHQLEILKTMGIKFQEKAEEILYLEENCTVGGDLYAILNFFHVVSKIGLANGNTANEVGQILFGRPNATNTCRLHEIYLGGQKSLRIRR